MKKIPSFPFAGITVALFACHSATPYDSWSVYGGSKDMIHYSASHEIDTTNVAGLHPVWAYHCGDVDSNSQIQVNPIVVGQTLYGVSPRLKLFAVDAVSGQLKWTFDPARMTAVRNWSMNVC